MWREQELWLFWSFCSTFHLLTLPALTKLILLQDLKVVLFPLKQNIANMYVVLWEFFGWLMLGDDAQLYLHYGLSTVSVMLLFDMSLMKKCVFPFKTSRKWSCTNSALNQREDFGLSALPKRRYWAEFCTIKLGNRALSQVYTAWKELPTTMISGWRTEMKHLLSHSSENHINSTNDCRKIWLCAVTQQQQRNIP